MATVDLGAPDQVLETEDGRFLRWRRSLPAFATTDLIKCPCTSPVATLVLSEFVDPDAPTTTTFTPQLGVADAFVLDSINGRTQSPTANAPSRSQVPVVLDLPYGGLWIRPVPSTGPITLQLVVTIREGARV